MSPDDSVSNTDTDDDDDDNDEEDSAVRWGVLKVGGLLDWIDGDEEIGVPDGSRVGVKEIVDEIVGR